MYYHPYFIGYPIQAIFSCISILSCTFFIVLILKYKYELYNTYEKKLFFILLVFYDILCVVSLFPALSNELKEKDYHGIDCRFSYKIFSDSTFSRAQMMLIQFFSLSGIIWTGFINLINYREIILNENNQISLMLLLLITFSISLITTLIPNLADDSYHIDSSWCWIDTDSYQVDLAASYHYELFYAVAWVIIIFILCVSLRIWIYYRRSGVDTQSYRNTVYIPIILFFCFIPLTVARILQEKFGYNQCALGGFLVFGSCVMRSLGFLNSIVYAWKSDTRAFIYTIIEEERE